MHEVNQHAILLHHCYTYIVDSCGCLAFAYRQHLSLPTGTVRVLQLRAVGFLLCDHGIQQVQPPDPTMGSNMSRTSKASWRWSKRSALVIQSLVSIQPAKVEIWGNPTHRGRHRFEHTDLQTHHVISGCARSSLDYIIIGGEKPSWINFWNKKRKLG